MEKMLKIGDELYLSIDSINLSWGIFTVVKINKKGNATLEYSEDNHWKPVVKANYTNGIIECVENSKRTTGGKWSLKNDTSIEIKNQVLRKNILNRLCGTCFMDETFEFFDGLSTDKLIKIEKIIFEDT